LEIPKLPSGSRWPWCSAADRTFGTAHQHGNATGIEGILVGQNGIAEIQLSGFSCFCNQQLHLKSLGLLPSRGGELSDCQAKIGQLAGARFPLRNRPNFWFAEALQATVEGRT
jgi:hypothetical protein